MKALKIFIILIIPYLAQCQSPNDTAIIASLSKIKYNYKKCAIAVKPGEWVKEHEKEVLPVTVTITNNSKDTLKYTIKEFRVINYSSDNELLIDSGNTKATDILRHVSTISVLLPYQDAQLNIDLIKARNKNDLHGKFKISVLITINRDNELEDGYIFNGKDGSFIKLPVTDIKARSHWLSSNVVII